MAWFADLAGKAETLLNNLDEQTGAALRNHNVVKARKQENSDFILHPDPSWNQRKRPIPRNLKKISPVPEPRSNYTPARKISPIQNLNKSPVKGNQEPVRNGVVKTKKPLKKSNQYTLDNCPDTLVCDTKGSNTDHFGLRQRSKYFKFVNVGCKFLQLKIVGDAGDNKTNLNIFFLILYFL